MCTGPATAPDLGKPEKPILLKRVFNDELEEFVLSCIRDLLKTLVVLFCVVVIHFVIELMALLNFAVWFTASVENIDLYWGIATIAISALIFLGKLAFSSPWGFK